MTTRAAIYLRISDDPNDTQLGVDRQREDCVALCKSKGWDYLVYTDNDVSATKKNVVRKDYQRMLKDIEAGKIHAIVPAHTDRLYRTLTDLLPLIDLCVRHNVTIAGVQSGELDLGTDTGRMIAKILGAVAEGEVERKTARQVRAMQQMAENGKGWGRRTFGYEHDHENPCVRPHEAEAVRAAYSELLTGASLYRIAKQWNAAGLRTAQSGNLWDTSSLGRVMRNPRNAGLRTYKGEIMGDGNWPAIVDRDTWDKAQHLMADPNRQFTKDRARVQLLGGILRCGECGKGLGTGKRQNGPRIYVCKTVGCLKINRKAEDLDAFVRELVIGRLMRATDWMRVPDEHDDTETLRTELAVLNARMNSLAADFADGDLTASQLKVATAKLRNAVAEVEAKLHDRVAPNVYGEILTADDMGLAFDELPLDRKRALIMALVDGITVNTLGKGGKSFPVGTGIVPNWRVHE